jgi:hypothetical protein
MWPKLEAPIRRFARRIVWRSPHLFQPIGRWKRNLDVLGTDGDFWVAGFPRSGNTFLWQLLQQLLPDLNIVGHLHVPPFIFHMLSRDRPGILVIRSPADAAVSWSVFTGCSIEHSLLYYIDFHAVLRPLRSELMVASFDEVTTNFPKIASRINARWSIGVPSVVPDEFLLGRVSERVEQLCKQLCPTDSGMVDEMRVSRPSPARKTKAEHIRAKLQDGSTSRMLAAANQIYTEFIAAGS